MISFQGKKFLVSGASSGIGREVARHFSELGAVVVLLARDQKRLEETLSMLEGVGHQCVSYDLVNPGGIKDLIRDAAGLDGLKFDGFVHCAGVVDVHPLRVIDYPKFERTLKINTYSYLEIVKHLVKKQASNEHASIVFVSSMLTQIPQKGQTTYINSKTAGESMSKVLSLELQRRKIRLNSVRVGPVATKMSEDTERFRTLASTEENQHHTYNRVLDPREISNLIMFLMSDSARYIIGECYSIDGGLQ